MNGNGVRRLRPVGRSGAATTRNAQAPRVDRLSARPRPGGAARARMTNPTRACGDTVCDRRIWQRASR
ncbi:hypothetical protein C0Z18_03545 [Trinickia dabaoshanensis]|uniref:Uncharacterized protein n=1 Tax=Trinickia dabaoshanensis TaxID=564714 RepID=A0A2N7W1J6_9BURK|nr:hypothetical protein C0Z18_03545 [Trinickia dabaoshanensis]